MKIAIIGAGNVGASIASLLLSRQMCDNIALITLFAFLSVPIAELSNLGTSINYGSIKDILKTP